MAPSYDTVGFLAGDAKLFREVGRVLLNGASVDAPLQRLIIAQDMVVALRGEHRRGDLAGAPQNRPRAARS